VLGAVSIVHTVRTIGNVRVVIGFSGEPEQVAFIGRVTRTSGEFSEAGGAGT
jgi:hypothetical protein